MCGGGYTITEMSVSPYSQVFVECVQLLRSASNESHEHTHLCLLLCSAALERALGDVSAPLTLHVHVSTHTLRKAAEDV